MILSYFAENEIVEAAYKGWTDGWMPAWKLPSGRLCFGVSIRTISPSTPSLSAEYQLNPMFYIAIIYILVKVKTYQ